MTGTTNARNAEYVQTSPYTGFVFGGSAYQGNNWWIWNEHSVKFVPAPKERVVQRTAFMVAGIPKSSPFVKGCFK